MFGNIAPPDIPAAKSVIAFCNDAAVRDLLVCFGKIILIILAHGNKTVFVIFQRSLDVVHAARRSLHDKHRTRRIRHARFLAGKLLDLVHIYAELIGEVILGNVQRIFDLSHRFNCGSNIVHIIICTAAAAAGKRGAHKANCQ